MKYLKNFIFKMNSSDYNYEDLINLKKEENENINLKKEKLLKNYI